MKHKNTAYIFRDAFAQNYNEIQNRIRENCAKLGRDSAPRVICVVKADAYGHGISTAAGALGDAGCDFFAVSSEEEAEELRGIESANGRHPDILILGHIMPENVIEMIGDDITCAMISLDNAKELSAAISDYYNSNYTRMADRKPLKIHIKLDTGMNRVGFAADPERLAETVAQIKTISDDENLSITGIFTHFACADDETLDGNIVPGTDGYTKMQLERYRNTVAALENAGIDVGLKHAANSAAILGCPDAYFDAVRAGIIIYGLMPNGAVDTGFTPAMQFDSSVTHVHKIRAGDKVSYGATFTADHDMTLATVAAGYADGFERAYSGCGVKIGGRLYKQVGRICMDQFMVDVTDAPEPIRIGDAVTLFGGDDGTMVRELAKLAGTINYEVICKVSKRVIREVIVSQKTPDPEKPHRTVRYRIQK
ncbi:MAG: alanine racemase [Clostridia bacterium]|nr:alanine racemase [Clostridia bacterium]MBQ8369864.1 alanine racemase [Clostridia bacterium]MBQ8512797.1 alanine racemase [Clostridia bacterium]